MTIRGFAHNPTGDPIPGAKQFVPKQILPGSEKYLYLVHGEPDTGYGASDLTWFAGPDEELGWLIARINVDDEGNPLQPTPDETVFAPLGFWVSDGLTDQAFLDLVNNLAMPLEVSYDDTTQAWNWLNINYYWTNYPNPLLQGLVTYYKFDQTLLDANGEYDASAPDLEYSTGVLGDAALFLMDSNSDIITETLPAMNQGTIAFWFNSNGYGNGQYVLGGNPFEIQIFQQAFYCKPFGDASYVITPTFNLNEWYFLVMTFDGTNKTVSLNAGTPSTETSTAQLSPSEQVIGISGPLLDYRIVAGSKMDEFGIWDRVLSQEEITDLYNNGVGRTYPFE